MTIGSWTARSPAASCATCGSGSRPGAKRTTRPVLARLWHGWTSPENADAYERLLRAEVLPGIESRIGGFRGVYLLRNEVAEEVEFVTVTLWESLEAVREFGGDDHEAAVVPRDAQRVLSRFDERVVHYEVLIEP